MHHLPIHLPFRDGISDSTNSNGYRAGLFPQSPIFSVSAHHSIGQDEINSYLIANDIVNQSRMFSLKHESDESMWEDPEETEVKELLLGKADQVSHKSLRGFQGLRGQVNTICQ